MRQKGLTNMKFEWFFNKKDFNKAQKSQIEDDIFGWVCVQTENDKYLIDIHKEYFNSKDKGYDLEVYYETETGQHGNWLGSLHDIRSAKTLDLFKKRAERLLTTFIANEEAA